VALASANAGGDPSRVASAREAFSGRESEVRFVRGEALAFVREATGDRTYNDVNYVFPTFITTYMPVGLVGLLIAAIFAAAMSTISAELASLSTATVIDFYRRFARPDADDRHYLRVSRLATGIVVSAIVAAMGAVLSRG
jgi:Na+/proline symporter